VLFKFSYFNKKITLLIRALIAGHQRVLCRRNDSLFAWHLPVSENRSTNITWFWIVLQGK